MSAQLHLREMKRPICVVLLALALTCVGLALPPPGVDVLSEDAAGWTTTGGITVNADTNIVAAGSISLRADVNDGFGVSMRRAAGPNEVWDLPAAGVVGLAFRARAVNPNDFQFQNRSPTVRLYSGANAYRQFVPASELLTLPGGEAPSFKPIAFALEGSSDWATTDIGTFDPAAVESVELWFDTWGGQPYQVWIDDFQFVTLDGLVLDSQDLILQEGWRWMNLDPGVAVVDSILRLPRDMAVWSSSDPAVVSVDAGSGLAEMEAPGQATVTASITTPGGVFSADCLFTVRATVMPPVTNAVPAELSSAPTNALFDLPVVVLRFLPTVDGVNLDTDQVRGYYSADPETLAAIEARIASFEVRSKFMIEEGSRFRGYARPDAIPSIGMRVVKIVTIYEQAPPGDDIYETSAEGKYRVDYERIFERFNLRRDIEEGGVKEVWMWASTSEENWPGAPADFRPEVSRRIWESNMSSPRTPDVSIKRTQAEVVHNRGHHMEAMLSWAAQRQDGNSNFFWNEFTGPNGGGRCGNTHYTPNSNLEYNYTNPAQVESDIEDWKPGGGTLKTIDYTRWRDLPYEWPATPGFPFIPQKTESQYYIYWFQAFPGHANALAYGPSRPNHWLTNWWAFMGDWDMAVEMQLGLYAPAMGSGSAQLDIKRSNPGAQLTFTLPSGHLPLLECSPSLVQPNWLQYTGADFTPTGVPVIAQPFDRWFWRLKAVPVIGQ